MLSHCMGILLLLNYNKDTWEKLLFVYLADFNPLRKICPWFPQITTNFSSLRGGCVWLFSVILETGSWATGHPGLEALLQLCDGLFLWLLPSNSVKVWVCHHSCTRICSVSCLHSKRHEGNLLQVTSNTRVPEKCLSCISTLVFCFSANCC